MHGKQIQVLLCIDIMFAKLSFSCDRSVMLTLSEQQKLVMQSCFLAQKQVALWLRYCFDCNTFVLSIDTKIECFSAGSSTYDSFFIAKKLSRAENRRQSEVGRAHLQSQQNITNVKSVKQNINIALKRCVFTLFHIEVELISCQYISRSASSVRIHIP